MEIWLHTTLHVPLTALCFVGRQAAATLDRLCRPVGQGGHKEMGRERPRTVPVGSPTQVYLLCVAKPHNPREGRAGRGGRGGRKHNGQLQSTSGMQQEEEGNGSGAQRTFMRVASTNYMCGHSE